MENAARELLVPKEIESARHEGELLIKKVCELKERLLPIRNVEERLEEKKFIDNNVKVKEPPELVRKIENLKLHFKDASAIIDEIMKELEI